MDLDEQGMVKKIAEENRNDDVVVVLGSPDADSAEIYAETVTMGDPAYAGPLAGVPLGLKVYHILEDEIKNQVEPAVYDHYVGVMEIALDKEAIVASMEKIRKLAGIS